MDLSAAAVHLPRGCRLRLALSPYNWPLVWPAAGPLTLLSLLPGGSLALPLKVRDSAICTQLCQNHI